MFNFKKKSLPTTTIFIDSYAVLTGAQLIVDDTWQLRHSANNLAHVLAQAINQTNDPLDQALTEYMHIRALSLTPHKPLRTFAFSHETGASGAIWHHGAEYQLAIKGIPERVLDHCDMSDNEREVVMMQLNAMSGKGSYVVALASGVIQRPIKHVNDLKKNEKLSFVGFVSLRLEVSSAARQCLATARDKGIVTYFATGLHPAAAYYLASQANLASHPNHIYDTRQLDTLNIANFVTLISTTKVFARATADQKRHILDNLKTIDQSTATVSTLEQFQKLLAN
jgi:Ca2+-transporting ATPase